MGIVDNVLAGASGNQGYFLNRSLRFRSSASAYLSRTNSSTGSSQRFTWSAWVKRGSISSASDQWLFCSSNFNTSSNVLNFGIIFKLGGGADADTLVVGLENTVSGTDGIRRTTQVFRDPSSWYHIVAAVDTTQATAANRIKVYVNGSEVTAFATNTNPALNANVDINQNGNTPRIGAFNLNNSPQRFFDGYMTEINFIDGQALTPSSFGMNDPATGVWEPKKYTGTYGTNGFYLPFTDNSAATATTIGKDFSGNGNNWTPNNISVTAGATYDSMTDVPTLTSPTAANYAVLNPLISSSYQAISNGNLTSKSNTSTDSGGAYSTFSTGLTGKWYVEFTADTSAGGGYPIIGTTLETSNLGTANGSAGIPGQNGNGSCGFRSNGNKYISGTSSSYGNSFVTNDVIGIAVDCDNGAIYFSINGTWQNSGVPTSGSSKTGAANTWTGGSISFYIGVASYLSGNGAQANFGQRPFSYTPPTGFVALNTFNLPTPTIGATPSSQANKYFDATLYTGNGSSLSVTNSGSMQPDFVWIKQRNGTGYNMLFDSVRGVQKWLTSNDTLAETTGTDNLSAFNSNGFTVLNGGFVNPSSGSMVGWQWRASNAAGVTNTAGSITSTVSANTTAGFSIVTYTGTGANATVGHGLGVAPRMVIVKRRNGGGTENWMVYHASITTPNANPAFNRVLLNLTNASNTDSAIWNNTQPTSSVFSVGTSSEVNANTGTYVAYCFAEVAGYSRFGSYTGNGSSDGTFVFTGFRPKYVLTKRTDSSSNWVVNDTSRSPYNITGANLYPNSSAAEESYTIGAPAFDFLSNGFKLRGSGSDTNGNGATYIYMAFAENPFKYALAR